MNKKGNIILGVLLIVIIIIIIVWLAGMAGRQCRRDTDCGTERYCGSDFKCHNIPVIEKTVIENHYDFTVAGFLIALGIVIAAIIIRRPIRK